MQYNNNSSNYHSSIRQIMRNAKLPMQIKTQAVLCVSAKLAVADSLHHRIGIDAV